MFVPILDLFHYCNSQQQCLRYSFIQYRSMFFASETSPNLLYFISISGILITLLLSYPFLMIQVTVSALNSSSPPLRPRCTGRRALARLVYFLQALMEKVLKFMTVHKLQFQPICPMCKPPTSTYRTANDWMEISSSVQVLFKVFKLHFSSFLQ